MHGVGTAAELLQFGSAAQHARRAVGGTARHGTAPVDHLTVQRDDAEGVAILPCHGDTAVHVLHHNGAAQQTVENILISVVKAHQSGGKAHEAELLLHAPLFQFVAPNSGQRQEGGTACVTLL